MIESPNEYIGSIVDYFKTRDNSDFPAISVVAKDYNITIKTNDFSGIIVNIDLLGTDIGYKVRLYLVCRIHTGFFLGDRTDLHDVLSLFLAIYLKYSEFKISSMLYDIGHPAGFENEMYGRYIVPTQYEVYQFDRYDKTIEFLEEIFFVKTLFFSLVGCPCHDCKMEKKITVDFSIAIPLHIEKLLNEKFDLKSSAINYIQRYHPTWFYFKDFKKNIGIIEQESICKFLLTLSEKNIYKSMNGINGVLIYDKNIGNFLSHTHSQQIREIYTVLKDDYRCTLLLENFSVSFGKKYIVFINKNHSHEAFEKERLKIKKRNDLEYIELFKNKKITWKENLNPERFEDLVKKLLEEENNFSNIRKVSPTNQPDGGKDLLAEYSEFVKFDFNNNTPINENYKIIIQCKASNKPIGKSKVTDIRDTIEHYDCQGYMLVTSNQITNQLTEHLHKLKSKRQYWIRWWNRDEVESRIIKNRSILIEFTDLYDILE